ncbi:MAG: hypothetical protein ACI88A_004850 [Paraglaciecola sp.]|jgi:hypothetical protein
MIISHTLGGLGNQMFQYAFGRALSLHYDVPLKLDVMDFAGYELHNGFELSRVFDLSVETASDSDFYEVLGWLGNRLARKVVRRLGYSKIKSAPILSQDNSVSAKEYIKIAGQSCYLTGYWQSESYFLGEKKTIREEFQFKTLMSAENEKWAEKIRNCHSVSVHVRRGDYVSNPHTHSVHGVCGIDYYNNAINYINERFEGLTFFVFSDDIPWALENLSIPSSSYYIDHNHGAESYNDMHLMSLCKHHIIANSSFSWWGAWLSDSVDSSRHVVIAPEHWANLQAIKFDEIYPNKWVRL